MLTVITDAACWSAQRGEPQFRPPELDTLGYVPCATAAEVLRRVERPDPQRIVLWVDPARLRADHGADRILGPIDREAVVEAVPLRPRTPADHTLDGVLTDVQLGNLDPAVRHRLGEALVGLLPKIRAWARSELRRFPEADVDEVTQEVLTIALAKLSVYVPHARYRSYLKRVTLNVCGNHRRKWQAPLTEDGLFDPASPEVDALARLEARQRDVLFEDAARAVLDPTEQEIVQLRYVSEVPLADIPARLTPSATAPRDEDEMRVALQRIRRRLVGELARRIGRDGRG